MGKEETKNMNQKSRRVLNLEVVALVASVIERDFVEGIFRSSGSRTLVDQLLGSFVGKEELSEFLLSHGNVTSLELCSALKRYLRDLRIPVISDESFGQLSSAVEPIGQDVGAADVSGLKAVFDGLENRECLRIVLGMLSAAMAARSTTGIDAENVGSVIAPSLFSQSLPLSTLPLQSRIVSVAVQRLGAVIPPRQQQGDSFQLPKRPTKSAPRPQPVISITAAPPTTDDGEDDMPGLKPLSGKVRRPLSCIEPNVDLVKAASLGAQVPPKSLPPGARMVMPSPAARPGGSHPAPHPISPKGAASPTVARSSPLRNLTSPELQPLAGAPARPPPRPPPADESQPAPRRGPSPTTAAVAPERQPPRPPADEEEEEEEDEDEEPQLHPVAKPLPQPGTDLLAKKPTKMLPSPPGSHARPVAPPKPPTLGK